MAGKLTVGTSIYECKEDGISIKIIANLRRYNGDSIINEFQYTSGKDNDVSNTAITIMLYWDIVIALKKISNTGNTVSHKIRIPKTKCFSIYKKLKDVDKMSFYKLDGESNRLAPLTVRDGHDGEMIKAIAYIVTKFNKYTFFPAQEIDLDNKQHLTCGIMADTGETFYISYDSLDMIATTLKEVPMLHNMALSCVRMHAGIR